MDDINWITNIASKVGVVSLLLIILVAFGRRWIYWGHQYAEKAEGERAWKACAKRLQHELTMNSNTMLQVLNKMNERLDKLLPPGKD